MLKRYMVREGLGTPGLNRTALGFFGQKKYRFAMYTILLMRVSRNLRYVLRKLLLEQLPVSCRLVVNHISNLQ